MTTLLPTPSELVALEQLRAAHEAGLPQRRLAFRHVPVHGNARVLSVLGLSGDNLPVGLAFGDVDADEPDTYICPGEPRDPALAVRAGAALAQELDRLVATHENGGLVQLLVDSTNTLQFLHSYTWRLRQPWLPGPYAAMPELTAAAERCGDAFALLRALAEASAVPGADVLLAAVPALNEHFVFPLGGEQEAQQLTVQLACLRRAGAPVPAGLLDPMRVSLVADLEDAEARSVSAWATPEFDNRQLMAVLAAFKRARAKAAGSNPAARIDRRMVTAAADACGLTGCVTDALRSRHATVAAAFRILRELAPLPSLPARATRARWRVNQQLSRGRAHDQRWRDFPALATADRAARDDANLVADAVIEAVREDAVGWAYATSTGQAARARVLAVGSAGTVVQLQLDAPLLPRSIEDWWWLDDTHPSPAIGRLVVHPATAAGMVRATWEISAQMRRLARDGLPRRVRLCCLDRPFDGRPWRPRQNQPVLAT